jgi:hypothetical protein
MAGMVNGPAIFLAQFAGDAAPFNSFEGMCGWAASLGYKGVQIPTWVDRLIDIDKAAESQTYCDELSGTARRPLPFGKNSCTCAASGQARSRADPASCSQRSRVGKLPLDCERLMRQSSAIDSLAPRHLPSAVRRPPSAVRRLTGWERRGAAAGARWRQKDRQGRKRCI